MVASRRALSARRWSTRALITKSPVEGWGYMQYDESFDLVIVGSGAASVPAALAAKSLGHSALIIEKQKVFGGSTAFSAARDRVPAS